MANLPYPERSTETKNVQNLSIEPLSSPLNLIDSSVTLILS